MLARMIASLRALPDTGGGPGVLKGCSKSCVGLRSSSVAGVTGKYVEAWAEDLLAGEFH
jgi:hypothetical protein